MISSSIIKNTLWHHRWKLLIFSIIVILYSAMIISFYPIVRDNSNKFMELIDTYPPALQEAFGITTDTFGSLEGFMSVEYLSFMWIIIISVLAFSLGATLVSGEIDKGTSDFLFSLPIKRWHIVVSKLLSYYIIMLVVIITTLLIMFIGVHIVGEEPLIKGYLAFLLTGSSTGFFLINLSAILSSMFSSNGKVYGVAGLFFIGSYLLQIFNGISDRSQWLYYFSFLKYYGNPQEILSSGSFDIRFIATLVGVGLILAILSLLITEKRNL